MSNDKLAQAEGLQPIETIQYWLNAYSDPSSGEHFMGHGMVVTLLREYLQLREAEKQAGPVALQAPAPVPAGPPVAEVYRAHYGGRTANIGVDCVRKLRDAKLPPPGTLLYAAPPSTLSEQDKEDAERLLRRLVEQIEKAEFIEENGHRLKMNAAYIAAKEAL